MTYRTNNNDNNSHDLIILIQLKRMNKMTIDQFKSLNDNWYSTLTIWICTLCFVLYCWLGEPLTKALAYSNWALHCESQHRSNENAAMKTVQECWSIGSPLCLRSVLRWADILCTLQSARNCFLSTLSPV